MHSKKISILGVEIDQKNHTECIETAAEFLYSGHNKKIYTPNPEMLVYAYKNPYFKEILNRGHLLLCDGKGIEFLSRRALTRLSGVDFIQDLCRLAAQQNKKVFLLGTGSIETLEQAKHELEKQHLGLEIVGMHEGITFELCDSKLKMRDPQAHKHLIQTIQDAEPEILLVAFGHGKQEIWIDEHLCHFPSVQIAMGVGGSFEFIAKKLSRAPQWMRTVGLEWLFRLCLQPKRIKRIWNAVVVFPFIYMISSK